MGNKKLLFLISLILSLLLIHSFAYSKGKYGPGASDTEIKIDHTNPYSGVASAYGVIGKAQAAYFKSSMRCQTP